MNNSEIICINDSKPSKDILKLFNHWIEKDKIYHIRKIQQNLNGTWGCLLEELINNKVLITIGNQVIGNAEVGYALDRFVYLNGEPLVATLEESNKLIKKINMNYEDLIPGEIYYTEAYGSKFLTKFKVEIEGSNSSGYIKTGQIGYSKRGYFDEIEILKNIRIATEKEKLWLNTCIKEDEFIILSEIKEEKEINYSIF